MGTVLGGTQHVLRNAIRQGKLSANMSDNGRAAIRTSSSFCVLPWLHLAFTVDGVIGRCCIDSTIFYNSYYERSDKPEMKLAADAVGCTALSGYAVDNPHKVHSIVSAFQSTLMCNARVAMMSGRSVAACRSCDDQEAMGRTSIRQISNRVFGRSEEVAELVRSTKVNGEVLHAPASLELRLGNYCNLRCQMCSFPTSHAWGQDADKESWCRTPIDPYKGDSQFWRDLREISHTLKHVYFAGGEPLLQPGHMRALSLFVEEKAAPQISLSYSSNLTIMPRKVLDFWRQFKRVHMGASCDGIGRVYESIRKGARWQLFADNVVAVRQCADVTLDVTVQKDNITTLNELWDWAIDARVNVVMTNILRSPVGLRFESLPHAELSDCAQRYRQCSERYRAMGLVRLSVEVDQLCEVIESALRSESDCVCGGSRLSGGRLARGGGRRPSADQ